MAPTIGMKPGSRILVSYSRNLFCTLTERVVLPGILVKVISKYKEANLTLTDYAQIKISYQAEIGTQT